MKCFLANCQAVLNAGATVVEVGGMLCCPEHVREVSVGPDGRSLIRPHQVVLRRGRYMDPKLPEDWPA